MEIEEFLMKLIGLPALISMITAIICAKYVSSRPYVIILFAILGALVGLDFVQ